MLTVGKVLGKLAAARRVCNLWLRLEDLTTRRFCRMNVNIMGQLCRYHSFILAVLYGHKASFGPYGQCVVQLVSGCHGAGQKLAEEDVTCTDDRMSSKVHLIDWGEAPDSRWLVGLSLAEENSLREVETPSRHAACGHR